jgi:pilus assembly protein Flp/PilA
MDPAAMTTMALIGRATKVARLFARDRSAATVIEYGLMAAILGIGIIAAVRTVGTEVTGLFQTVESLFPK